MSLVANTLITNSESPSRMASEMPTSLANSRALVADMASISVGWRSCGIFSDIAAIAKPSLSRTITPTPEQFSSAKTAPSKLILKISAGGGFHRVLLWGRLGGVGGRMARYSTSLSAANRERWSKEQHGCWERTWFL